MLDLRYGRHVIDALRELPAGSVQCVVTSPPYYGLRSYGVPASVWGGDANCVHEWTDASWKNNRWGVHDDDSPGAKQETNSGSLGHRGQIKQASVCSKCGAWLGCYGLEPTVEMYVANTVLIFREVRRVLRDDGTLWLNIGDSWAANRGSQAPSTKGGPKHSASQGFEGRGSVVPDGLKAKDLIGVPWQLAFALRADGWYLRSEIIWAKRNAMPESVKDRPSKSHEQVFLLTKKARYFYDRVSSSEPSVRPGDTQTFGGPKADAAINEGDPRFRNGHEQWGRSVTATETRNLRSIWLLSGEGFKGAHFATMPTELVRKCLLAGTSQHECCPMCRAPWRRLLRKDRVPTRPGIDTKLPMSLKNDNRELIGLQSRKSTLDSVAGNRDPQRHTTTITTIGWQQTCKCDPHEPIPCTVLDPFSGSGTCGAVADFMGLDYIGIDLNPDYEPMVAQRVAQYAEKMARKAKRKRIKPRPEQLELFSEQ